MLLRVLKLLLSPFDGLQIGSFEIRLNSAGEYVSFLFVLLFLFGLVIGAVLMFAPIPADVTNLMDDEPNNPPEAQLSTDSPDGERTTEEMVLLDATQSEDPDGNELEYEFDVTGDGVADYSGVDSMEYHQFDEPGVHEVTLTVVDDEGDTDSDIAFVTVSPTETEEDNGDNGEDSTEDDSSEEDDSDTEESEDDSENHGTISSDELDELEVSVFATNSIDTENVEISIVGISDDTITLNSENMNIVEDDEDHVYVFNYTDDSSEDADEEE